MPRKLLFLSAILAVYAIGSTANASLLIADSSSIKSAPAEASKENASSMYYGGMDKICMLSVGMSSYSNSHGQNVSPIKSSAFPGRESTGLIAIGIGFFSLLRMVYHKRA